MRLTILLPRETLVDREVAKVVAEAPNGFFGLLPRHADFATALVPGILFFTTPESRDVFVAVDEGVLVKQGDTVRVSARNAVLGEQPGDLEGTVAREFRRRDEHEEKARRAMNRIEAGFARRFLEIRHQE